VGRNGQTAWSQDSGEPVMEAIGLHDPYDYETILRNIPASGSSTSVSCQ
jgi:hypothetical protein